MGAGLDVWLVPALVVCTGFLVLGITGFGSALVVVPLLSWRWPLQEVVPVVIALDVVASVVHGGLNLSRIQWTEVRRLVPGMVAGVALGWLLARWSDSRLPLLILGLYVIGVGIHALRPAGARPQPPVAPLWAHPVGMVVGAIEVMFGTAGPPVVAWLTRRLQDPAALRASTPMVLLLASLVALGSMAADGRLFGSAWTQRLAVLLPFAVGGVLLGHAVAGQLPADRLRQAICVLLMVSGLALVARAGVF